MATALSILKKALCLGQCGKTTTVDDVAPASYELEVHAKTCEKYAVVLRAVCTVTVGPKKKTEPLLLQAKPDPNDGGCPSRVKELVEHHVCALAAGMTAEQMLVVNGSSNLVKEALGRVNLDLAKSQSGGGLFVHCTRIERFTVDVPSNKPRMVGFTQCIMAPVLVVDHETLMAHWNNQMAYWNNQMAHWAYRNNQRSWWQPAAPWGPRSGSMKVQGQKNSSMARSTQHTSVHVDVNNASVTVAVEVEAPAMTMIKGGRRRRGGGVGTQVQMQRTAHGPR